MRRLALAFAAVVVSGCAPFGVHDRGDVVRQMLASTVQLRSEREGGTRRAASGVVLFADGRTGWIITTRHFLDPPVSQTISVATTSRPRRPLRGTIAAVSPDSDLAVIRVEDLGLPAVRLRETARLGDPVWVVAFPWGRRATLVSGVVSQLTTDSGDGVVEGAASMVDASVSYGASGGGVFDAETGELIALVEAHRTARVALPDARERTFDMPVPGETTVVSVAAIRRFVATTPLAEHFGR